MTTNGQMPSWEIRPEYAVTRPVGENELRELATALKGLGEVQSAAASMGEWPAGPTVGASITLQAAGPGAALTQALDLFVALCQTVGLPITTLLEATVAPATVDPRNHLANG
jgi:hypothetical protein